jgi:hypothetical protein
MSETQMSDYPSESDPQFWNGKVFNQRMYEKACTAYERECEQKALAAGDAEREERERLFQESIKHRVPTNSIVQNAPLKTSVKSAQDSIVRYLGSFEYTSKIQTPNDILMDAGKIGNEIKKIQIHSDYKSSKQMTPSELRMIDTLDKTVKAREAQLDDSQRKIQRLDEQIETQDRKLEDGLEQLKLEYEAKCKALSTKVTAAKEKLELERKKSEDYSTHIRAIVQQLEENKEKLLTTNVQNTANLSQTDYTKLRQMKSQMEDFKKRIDDWKSYHAAMDQRLKDSLESFHNKEYHKIDPYELETVHWLETDLHYDSEWWRVSREIQKQIEQINTLLNISMSDSD